MMIGAVDIGGTKIAVGLVSAHGAVVSRREIPTLPERNFDLAMDRITALVQEVSAGYVLHGVGVGCTGPVDPFLGTIGNVQLLPGWEGGDLVGGLSARLGVPVVMENDADAAALGEFAWGAGQCAKRLIYLTISTGIGAGLVFDGQLYRGAEGAHPEIGHFVIDPSGPTCTCGARGCWESLASGLALARDCAPFDAQQVCAAAKQEDVMALRAVQRVGYYLGIGVANLVTLFTPDVIVLGGGLMQSRFLFWEAIQHAVRTQCGYVPHEKTRLVPAAFGSQTGLIGAAQVYIHRQG